MPPPRQFGQEIAGNARRGPNISPDERLTDRIPRGMHSPCQDRAQLGIAPCQAGKSWPFPMGMPRRPLHPHLVRVRWVDQRCKVNCDVFDEVSEYL